jgi:hypothetical protein
MATPKGERANPVIPALQGGGWTASRDLESLYNDEGQQRGGVLLGLLRLVPGASPDHPVVRALRRGPFNVNPVLAGYVLAPLAVRLARPVEGGPVEGAPVPAPVDGSRPDASPAEAAGSPGTPPLGGALLDDDAAVERARNLLAPVVSSLGDRLMWGGVRPVLSLVAVLGGVLWIGEPAAWYWLGYNGVQWHWRRRAWRTGLLGEDAVLRDLSGVALRRWISVASSTGRFLLGGAVGVILTWLWLRERLGPREETRGVLPLLFLGCTLIGFLLARRGRPGPLAMGWIALLAAGAAALARHGLGELGR